MHKLPPWDPKSSNKIWSPPPPQTFVPRVRLLHQPYKGLSFSEGSAFLLGLKGKPTGTAPFRPFWPQTNRHVSSVRLASSPSRGGFLRRQELGPGRGLLRAQRALRQALQRHQRQHRLLPRLRVRSERTNPVRPSEPSRASGERARNRRNPRAAGGLFAVEFRGELVFV